MWNKRRNLIIWLGFRGSSRFSWGFPLLLPVVEETLEEASELLSLGKPWYTKKTGLLYTLLLAARELLGELRRTGPCILVRVRTSDANVDIRLI